jgi:hypothetical protein
VPFAAVDFAVPLPLIDARTDRVDASGIVLSKVHARRRGEVVRKKAGSWIELVELLET